MDLTISHSSHALVAGLALTFTAHAADITFITDITAKDGKPSVNQVVTRIPQTAFAVSTGTPPFVLTASLAKDSPVPVSISFGISAAGLNNSQHECDGLVATSQVCQLYINPLASKPGEYAVTQYITYGISPNTTQSFPVIKLKKVRASPYKSARLWPTRTPIRHLVVIFDENNSFDRYFGTYPYATNQDGILFQAKPGTPIPENYLQGFAADGSPVFKDALVRDNPNQVKPFRLGHDDYICTNDHEYRPELDAVGWPYLTMDRFVQNATQSSTAKNPATGRYWNEFCANPLNTLNPKALPGGQVMGYFDGNSVTALWNYAQNFAISDGFHQTTYGPSTLGHLALVAATTGPVYTNPLVNTLDYFVIKGYLINDMWALYDDCSFSAGLEDLLDSGAIQTNNIGDLLTHARVPWGWFSAGFTPTGYSSRGFVECNAARTDRYGVTSPDYSSSNEPFQFFVSTSNPGHLPPMATRLIGSQDQANHQYDLSAFDKALMAGKLPAVTFLKPPISESGHGNFSNPIDEQRWLTTTINKIQRYPDWKRTAIVITYDDSDGDYDHIPPPTRPGPGPHGYGVRLPFLVVSPWSKVNYIDHERLDHGSLIRFIRYNWGIAETLGPNAADQYSGSMLGLFDFTAEKRRHPNPRLFLNTNGIAVKGGAAVGAQ